MRGAAIPQCMRRMMLDSISGRKQSLLRLMMLLQLAKKELLLGASSLMAGSTNAHQRGREVSTAQSESNHCIVVTKR